MNPLVGLDDWLKWYEATRNSLRRVQRIAEKYWPELPWDGKLGRDNTLGLLEGDTVAEDAALALAKLDDLAVIELFSRFESIVRTLVTEQVRAAAVNLSHPMLIAAAKEATAAADRRSFAAVLNSYAKGNHPEIADNVRRVRRYRNWLTHGRRGKPEPTIDPKTAYQRLRKFLELVVTALPQPEGAGGRTMPDAIP